MIGARIPPQSGLTSMELLVAGFLGVLLTLCGGFLFTTQIRGYNDIRDQARMQSDMKKALAAITRQVSNAGACLPDPRTGFTAGNDKLAFRYVDVNRKWCPNETDILTMAFYARPGGQVDQLIQEVRCPGTAPRVRTVFEAPGGLELAFRYQDASGTPTSNVSRIKAVEIGLAMHTRKSAGRAARARMHVLRVNCPNLR